MRKKISSAFMFCLLAHQCTAETTTKERFGIRATVYSPDWVWQGQPINVLVVVENTSARFEFVEAHIRGDDTQFPGFHKYWTNVRVPQGTTARTALTVPDTSLTTPGEEHYFGVSVNGPQSIDAPSLMLHFPVHVRIVRGAAVAEGIWAMLAPAFIAALWCGVFWWYLRRNATPGAWRTPHVAECESASSGAPQS